MDHALLLLFLITSCWFYVAVLLALNDPRWNVGRIAQSGICACAGGWLLLAGKTNATPLSVLGALFCATVIVPLFLRRLVHRRLLVGRLASAQFFQTVIAWLTWGRVQPLFAGIERIERLIRSELGNPTAQGYARRLLLPLQGAFTRSSFHGAQVEALVALQQYKEAEALCREHFAEGKLKPSLSLRFALATALAEMGKVDRASACLRRAAETEETPSALDVRPFLAYMHVFACGGRSDDVEYLLAQTGRLTALLPPAYPHLWRGMALMRAVRRDAAETAFARARACLRPADELLGRLIERHSAAPPAAGQATVPPAASYALDALRRNLELTPASPAASSRRWRPLVTYGFIAATVVVWFMTERAGSSTDARTLLRFGANMPALVMHGQWWRLVSSVFLHVGMMHLVFNAYACYLFGSFVERTSGRWSTFTVLVLSGAGGSAASALFSSYFGRNTISAGASGAVFGLLGAAIVIVLRLPGYFSRRQRRFYAFNLIFIAAANVVFGLLEQNVDNLAHAGGFASGLLCGMALMSRISNKASSPAWPLAAFFSIILLASSAVGSLYNLSTGGYPHRFPPMKSVSGPKGRWRITVPVFWEQVVKGESVAFSDPFGPRLEIREGARTRLLVPPRRTLHRRRLTIRGQRINEIVMLGGESGLCVAYHLNAGGKNYLLLFTCTPGEAKDYGQLFRRILAGFEPGQEASSRLTPGRANAILRLPAEVIRQRWRAAG